MEYGWTAAKARRNLAKHGLDFVEVEAFDWLAALIEEDCREAYGEQRFRAIGPLAGRLVVLVYTLRGETCHVISLRNALKREVKFYERQRALPRH